MCKANIELNTLVVIMSPSPLIPWADSTDVPGWTQWQLGTRFMNWNQIAVEGKLDRVLLEWQPQQKRA